MSWSVAAEPAALPDDALEPIPPAAERLFGAALPVAARYAGLLAGDGARRGLIGPRESARIWTRHLVNCAALAPLVPPDARVVDVGSGAGLPGIPLAIARPDLWVTLLEPLARRTSFLDEVVPALGLTRVRVVRSPAVEHATAVGRAYDVVTARAVTDLVTLHAWAGRLLAPGGILLAIKGDRAAEELAAAGPALGGVAARIVGGAGDAATVVVIESGGGGR